MATMNVSLPELMKVWVEDQTKGGKYGNASDYVRDLIRKDQERQDVTVHTPPFFWTCGWGESLVPRQKFSKVPRMFLRFAARPDHLMACLR